MQRIAPMRAETAWNYQSTIVSNHLYRLGWASKSLFIGELTTF
jgi:hypothetical protein